jgi:hypothetical protein
LAGAVDTTTVVPPLKTDPMTVGPMAVAANPTEGPANDHGTPAHREAQADTSNAGTAAGVVAALALVIGATIARAPTRLASAARDLFVEDISVTPLGHRRCRPVGAAGNLGAAFDVLALAKK